MPLPRFQLRAACRPRPVSSLRTTHGEFLTATDINHVLGKVFTAVAKNRIPLRTGQTLAYLGQLMLCSLPSVKKEGNFTYKFAQWNNTLDKAPRLSPPPPTATPLPEKLPDDTAIPETEAPPSIASPTES